MTLETIIARACDRAEQERRSLPDTTTFETDVDGEYAVGIQDEHGGRIASTVAVTLAEVR